MISQRTLISTTTSFSPIMFKDAFPGTCIGADIDDNWLISNGYARISTPGDYKIDVYSQKLVALSPPSYNATSGLWDAYAIQSMSLSGNITAKIAQIESLFSRKISDGINYAGKNAQIDDKSRGLINGAVSLAQIAMANGSGWNANFKWRMTDNSWMPLGTPQDMLAFGVAVGSYYAALFFASSSLKDACSSANTDGDLASIDINSGWPPN